MMDRRAMEAEVLEQVCTAVAVLLRGLERAGGVVAERDQVTAEFAAQIEALCRSAEQRYTLNAREAGALISAALARAAALGDR